MQFRYLPIVLVRQNRAFKTGFSMRMSCNRLAAPPKPSPTLSLCSKPFHGQVFGRSNAIQLLDLSPSAVSALLKKLLDCCVIETVTSMGKGKYRFSAPCTDQ